MTFVIQRTTNSPERPRGRPLDLPAVLIALGAAVLSYGVAVTLLIVVPLEPETAGLAQYLVSGLAPLVAVAILVVVRVRGLGALGVRRIPVRWVLISIGCGVLAIVLSIAASVILILVTGPPSGDLQADYAAASRGGPLLLVLTLLAGAVLTPIGEELLFRGVVTNWLLRFGPWVAVPVGAAVFAPAHGINYVLPVAFVIGIITGLLFHATRSIWPGVIVHVVNNGYSIVADALARSAA